MNTLKEDDLEEEEFRSMSTWEQQRYHRKMQEMNQCFEDILTDFKRKCEEKIYLDEEFLKIHKENFNDHLSNWRYQISKWKERNSEKKKSSVNLEQELGNYLKKYIILYSSTLKQLGNKESEETNDKEFVPESEKLNDAVILTGRG